MTFCQISSIYLLHGLVIFSWQTFAFSGDQLIFQKLKLDFSITKPCRCQFEAAVFNQEWPILYLVPLPSKQTVNSVTDITIVLIESYASLTSETSDEILTIIYFLNS